MSTVWWHLQNALAFLKRPYTYFVAGIVVVLLVMYGAFLLNISGLGWINVILGLALAIILGLAAFQPTFLASVIMAAFVGSWPHYDWQKIEDALRTYRDIVRAGALAITLYFLALFLIPFRGAPWAFPILLLCVAILFLIGSRGLGLPRHLVRGVVIVVAVFTLLSTFFTAVPAYYWVKYTGYDLRHALNPNPVEELLYQVRQDQQTQIEDKDIALLQKLKKKLGRGEELTPPEQETLDKLQEKYGPKPSEASTSPAPAPTAVSPHVSAPPEQNLVSTSPPSGCTGTQTIPLSGTPTVFNRDGDCLWNMSHPDDDIYVQRAASTGDTLWYGPYHDPGPDTFNETPSHVDKARTVDGRTIQVQVKFTPRNLIDRIWGR